LSPQIKYKLISVVFPVETIPLHLIWEGNAFLTGDFFQSGKVNSIAFIQHSKLKRERKRKRENEKERENKKRNSKFDGVRDVDEKEWLLLTIHKEAEGSGSGRHIHLHHHSSPFHIPAGTSCLQFVIHPNSSITE
jgi:hypothetical protein